MPFRFSKRSVILFFDFLEYLEQSVGSGVVLRSDSSGQFSLVVRSLKLCFFHGTINRELYYHPNHDDITSSGIQEDEGTTPNLNPTYDDLRKK